jgi:hypothetical protein
MKTFQQGQADGLCGLYSLLHFLKQTNEFASEDGTDVLWYLLEAARHNGWLNPYTLTQGFEDFQLKSILDLQIKNYRMSFRTVFLRDARQASKISSAKALLEAVTRKGGSAVVSSQRRDHWLLVTPENGTARVIDSANAKNPVTKLASKPRSFSPDWGLVILPERQPRIELNL